MRHEYLTVTEPKLTASLLYESSLAAWGEDVLRGPTISQDNETDWHVTYMHHEPYSGQRIKAIIRPL